MANSSTPASHPKLWYEANCHCGTVKYRINLPDLSSHQVNCCNCSVCTKNGYLLVYPKPNSEVEWHQGYDTLKGYQFGHKRVTHRFCGECGSSIFIDFCDGEKLGVNVRMIRDIEVDKLNFRYFDGKHQLGPEYEV